MRSAAAQRPYIMRPQFPYSCVPLLFTLVLFASSCSNPGMFGGGEAGATIEQHGAAISKPIPKVAVFVPRTSDGWEKQFGDEQLRAIVPAMKDLAKFNELDLSGTSVSDAGVRHLKTLTELERLDVAETAVTVDALMDLQHLPMLTFIAISRGQYSDDAVAALKRAFPKGTVLEVGRPTRLDSRGHGWPALPRAACG